jgi:hypothetical protein
MTSCVPWARMTCRYVPGNNEELILLWRLACSFDAEQAPPMPPEERGLHWATSCCWHILPLHCHSRSTCATSLRQS